MGVARQSSSLANKKSLFPTTIAFINKRLGKCCLAAWNAERMFRFSILSLFLLTTAVALWISTIAGYESAHDVRAFVMLSVCVAAGVAAAKYDGRRRAFWLGFFLT